jgi:hypothetical protein
MHGIVFSSDFFSNIIFLSLKIIKKYKILKISQKPKNSPKYPKIPPKCPQGEFF